MARYVLTDPQLEALKAGWDAGSRGMPDHRWAVVQAALDQPPPAGRGAVEIELDDAAALDLREGFGAGYEGGIADEPSHAAMAEAMAGVAQMLDIEPTRSFGY